MSRQRLLARVGLAGAAVVVVFSLAWLAVPEPSTAPDGHPEPHTPTRAVMPTPPPALGAVEPPPSQAMPPARPEPDPTKLYSALNPALDTTFPQIADELGVEYVLCTPPEGLITQPMDHLITVPDDPSTPLGPTYRMVAYADVVPLYVPSPGETVAVRTMAGRQARMTLDPSGRCNWSTVEEVTETEFVLPYEDPFEHAVVSGCGVSTAVLPADDYRSLTISPNGEPGCVLEASVLTDEGWVTADGEVVDGTVSFGAFEPSEAPVSTNPMHYIGGPITSQLMEAEMAWLGDDLD